MDARLEPEFLDVFDDGRRFALWVHPPGGAGGASRSTPRGSILCVQPFGDEANLGRRVLVAQARRLAHRGWTTLIVDLFGTGDSDGETAEATLARWDADLLAAARRLRESTDGRVVLWGTRMGALLAARLASQGGSTPDAMVLWQPPARGSALVDPLLKLAKIGAIARGAAPSEDPSADRTAGDDVVDRDGLVDVAGYRLRGSLLEDLSQLTLVPPQGSATGTPCPVLVLGVQRVLPATGAAPKALGDLAGAWTAAGHAATVVAVQGEPFWASLEPSTPQAAFEATELFLEGVSGKEYRGGGRGD